MTYHLYLLNGFLLFFPLANIVKIVQIAAIKNIKKFAKYILNLSGRKKRDDKGNFKEILGI